MVLSLINIIIFISVIFLMKSVKKKGMYIISIVFIVMIKCKLIVLVGWFFFYLYIIELFGIS